MLKGSFSLTRLRWVLLVVLRDELVCPQKLLRSSPGDGGKQTPESLISVESRCFSGHARDKRSHDDTTYHSVCILYSACRSGRLTLAGHWSSRRRPS